MDSTGINDVGHTCSQLFVLGSARPGSLLSTFCCRGRKCALLNNVNLVDRPMLRLLQ